MDRRSGLVVVLVLAGVALIGYGLVTGDEGLQWMAVDPVPAEQVPDGTATIEYDYLTPETQDAFREALESEEEMRFDSRPPDGEYVRYRDSFYRVTVIFAAANQSAMFFSILGGVGLLLLAGLVGAAPKIRERRAK